MVAQGWEIEVSGNVQMNHPVAIGCPGCGGISFSAGPTGVPICDYCQGALTSFAGECYRCGSAFKRGVRLCPSCGANLVRECPACGVLNPVIAGRCLVCGQTLVAIDAMLARLPRSTPDHLRRVREAGATIKAREEAASQARLADFWAEDDRRREELGRARAERTRQERLGLALVVGMGVIFVVIAVVLATRATGDMSLPLF